MFSQKASYLLFDKIRNTEYIWNILVLNGWVINAKYLLKNRIRYTQVSNTIAITKTFQ